MMSCFEVYNQIKVQILTNNQDFITSFPHGRGEKTPVANPEPRVRKVLMGKI